MTDETYTFEQARARLEEIAKQAKNAPLEKCLDLLEEGVRLANICTEKIDHTRLQESADDAQDAGADQEGAEAADEPADATADDE
ncbi:MAG: hypothetical protein Kow0056_00630 [Coriobacteriia bacterium]